MISAETGLAGVAAIVCFSTTKEVDEVARSYVPELRNTVDAIGKTLDAWRRDLTAA